MKAFGANDDANFIAREGKGGVNREKKTRVALPADK